MGSKDEKGLKIGLLQKNLQTIRQIAGWTLEEFAERIGVTKQTISNLERMKTKMNLTQYLAIRSVLDYEMKEHSENDTLPKAIALLLDKGREMPEEKYDELKQAIDTVAVACYVKAEKGILPRLFAKIVGPLVLGVGMGNILSAAEVGNIAISPWLRALFKGKDE